MKPIDLKSVKLGSDAEVFLLDLTGRPFPACGIIGGTKDEPIVLDPDGCAVQEDNVMLEFNTAVSGNERDWVHNLSKAMDLAFARVPPTLRPDFSATQKFDARLLECPQAKVFGCHPDFNAWTKEQNPRPRADDPTLRSAAAHVHISWDDPEDMEQRIRVIQFCDIFAVLPSLAESPDRERRKLYGKAGAFRPKKYGVEHRVLDNYWISDRGWMTQVWRRYQKAIRAANTEFQICGDLAKCVQDVINNYDIKAAKAILQEVEKAVFPRSEGDLDPLAAAKQRLFEAAYAGSAQRGPSVT